MSDNILPLWEAHYPSVYEQVHKGAKGHLPDDIKTLWCYVRHISHAHSIQVQRPVPFSAFCNLNLRVSVVKARLVLGEESLSSDLHRLTKVSDEPFRGIAWN